VKLKISLLLVDDHALVREMLSERLSAEPDMVVVGTAANADDAIGQAVRLRPDIVVMDVDMPGVLCFEAARVIQERCAGTRILFLSAFFHDRYVEQALAAKAAGYVIKADPPERIVAAIRSVAGGASYFSEEVQERIVVSSEGTRLAARRQSRAATLTPRELEILRYIARGLAQKEVARTMHVSVPTVRTHTANLMKKLGIHDRVELTRFAIREGLAEA
jgi:two-component system response regulator NreC